MMMDNNENNEEFEEYSSTEDGGDDVVVDATIKTADPLHLDGGPVMNNNVTTMQREMVLTSEMISSLGFNISRELGKNMRIANLRKFQQYLSKYNINCNGNNDCIDVDTFSLCLNMSQFIFIIVDLKCNQIISNLVSASTSLSSLSSTTLSMSPSSTTLPSSSSSKKRKVNEVQQPQKTPPIQPKKSLSKRRQTIDTVRHKFQNAICNEDDLATDDTSIAEFSWTGDEKIIRDVAVFKIDDQTCYIMCRKPENLRDGIKSVKKRYKNAKVTCVWSKISIPKKLGKEVSNNIPSSIWNARMNLIKVPKEKIMKVALSTHVADIIDGNFSI